MRLCIKNILLVLVVVSLVTFVGTNLQSVQAQAQEAKYKIYLVSHGGPGDPFWGRVIKGMKDADASLDEVEAHFLGPEVYSVDKILDFLETAAAANPAGIGCTITNYKALDEPLRRIIKQGIPVIAYNVADPRPQDERIPYLTYIGQSPYIAGRGAAKRMLEKFTPTRAVVSIHEVGHTALEARAKGIMDVLKDKGVPVEKLATTPDPTKTIGILKSYLKKHPDTDAIFTLGPLDTHPAIQLVKEENLQGKVWIGGFDLTSKILQAIKDGIVVYTVDQQPYLQGYLTVQWLYLHAKYGLVPPKKILTGPAIVDKSNVDLVMELVKKGIR